MGYDYFVDKLLSSPFASHLCATQETKQMLKDKKVVYVTSEAHPFKPGLDRLIYVFQKTLLIAGFIWNWKVTTLALVAGLALKYYVRSTRHYTHTPKSDPITTPRKELTPEIQKAANCQKWREKWLCDLYFSCFILGQTEIHAIEEQQLQASDKIQVTIGDISEAYTRSFLMTIPFFHTLLKWENECLLSDNFPVKHLELRYLEGCFQKAASNAENTTADFLGLKEDAFALVLFNDPGSTFKLAQSSFQKTVHYANPYIKRSNFGDCPPSTKTGLRSFEFLPTPTVIEKLNKITTIDERQQALIQYLNSQEFLQQNESLRHYFANKTMNEFIEFLHEQANYQRTNPTWSCLHTIIDQCPHLKQLVTVFNFPCSFKLDQKEWGFLQNFPKLLWLQIDVFDTFNLPPNSSTFPIRVVSISGKIFSSSEKTSIQQCFSTAEICELED